jgi:hypothetical protein
LNLNDIAENNLKKMHQLGSDAANLEPKWFRYQNYTAVIIVKVKM